MEFIDTHSHLFSIEFSKDRENVLKRALDSGVTKMVLPAIDSDTHAALHETLNLGHLLYGAMGLHPTSVNGNSNFKTELAIVEHLFSQPNNFVAVGEVGLDLYWSKDSIKEQIEALEFQIELSLKHKLPLIIHTRDAFQEMITVLSGYKSRGLRGVLHGFSGTINDYHAIKNLGEFYFGIGGVVTFKKSTLDEVVRLMALSDIVLETDCPYLAPAPHRGKRNESSYIPLIAQKIADIKNVSIETIAAQTTSNAKHIFNI